MRRAAVVVWGIGVIVATAAGAAAAPAEPRRAHPRMLLDASVRSAWRADAEARRGPVHTAVDVCTRAGEGALDGAGYQGAEWAKGLQACLVASVATERPAFAATAIRLFTALIDDLDRIGDGRGGDQAARRDNGYAIRNLGPYTALAYDWLHAHPAMTPALRERARQRWAAWLAWYREKGYRARVAGTNYQAGYLAAATLIAVAQGGEAGEAGGALWTYVADELWGKDLAAALAPGGILAGGDWPEGWQYGPLAVAHYALAARIARAAGIAVAGVEPWLAALLRRHVYALTPGDRLYVGQDTEAEVPNVAPNLLTLAAVALGGAAADDRRWAQSELSRLGLADANYTLYGALAMLGDRAVPIPRAGWPLWYLAANTGTLHARTRWDARAVWFVAECQRTLDVDHRQFKAGNFVLSRGADDAIVDPSPYGSQSTLTSNAPTVASAQLPGPYQPSQAPWSEQTAWRWTQQARSGVVAARCDYADQYRFQHRPSDVPAATRDFVLVPSSDGSDAALLVIDRADTTAAARAMHLRFRVPGALAIAGSGATAQLGATRLAIARLDPPAAGPPAAVLGKPTAKDCFVEGTVRGRCDAARFPVQELRLELPGPTPHAAHVITVAGAAGAAPVLRSAPGWSAAELAAPRAAFVVWPTRAGAAFAYRAPRAARTHVVLDAGAATLTAARDGDSCVVQVVPGAPGAVAIAALDASCRVTVDPATPPATATAAVGPATTTPTPSSPKPADRRAAPRSGCCAAQASPASSLALAALVAAGLGVRRRRRRGSAGGREPHRR